jgi:hypothetical protein
MHVCMFLYLYLSFIYANMYVYVFSVHENEPKVSAELWEVSENLVFEIT